MLEGRLDLVAHVHLADSPGRGEPGSGSLDWRARLAWLEQNGYDGFVGLEYRRTNERKCHDFAISLNFSLIARERPHLFAPGPGRNTSMDHSARRSAMARVDDLVDAMTLEEQVSLLSGEDFWSLPAIQRLGNRQAACHRWPKRRPWRRLADRRRQIGQLSRRHCARGHLGSRPGRRDRLRSGRGGQVQGRTRVIVAHGQYASLRYQRAQFRVLLGRPDPDG